MSATAQSPRRPRLIAIGGLSGTGKSTLARSIAQRCPDAVVLRSDIERKLQFGVTETTRLGPEGYTAEATAKVYSALAEKAALALHAGASVIVDAVFARPQERLAIEAIAIAAGTDFVGLWLDAPHQVQKQRVEARHGDASDATADVVDRQAAYHLGPIAWHRVYAGNGPEMTLAVALTVLGHQTRGNE